MIVSFSGHRPDKIGGYNERESRTLRYLGDFLAQRLDQLRPKRAICGMALGFDQLAAEVCITLKIPLVAAVPFHGQERRWPEAAQNKYTELISKATEVHIICEGAYRPWMMQARNEWMVDRADLVIAAWDGSLGGTANCLAYAQRIGKPVENLWRGRVE